MHVLLFPKYEAIARRRSLLAEWEKMRRCGETVLKALEEVRQAGAIGNSLEAKVVIRASGETAELLRRHESDLRYIFIVSQVAVVDPLRTEEILQVEVLKADGKNANDAGTIPRSRQEGLSDALREMRPGSEEITNDN